jgi:hypothetical protein
MNKELFPKLFYLDFLHHRTPTPLTSNGTRKLIADAWEWKDEDEVRPRIAFTTTEKLMQSGVFDGGIWEEACPHIS